MTRTETITVQQVGYMPDLEDDVDPQSRRDAIRSANRAAWAAYLYDLAHGVKGQMPMRPHKSDVDDLTRTLDAYKSIPHCDTLDVENVFLFGRTLYG